MIDIHTHILPGIDDGAQNWEDTLELARAAAKDGIATVIATPHHANGAYTNPAGVVAPLVEQANALLQREGVPLTIAAGQEIRAHEGMLEAWTSGELLTLAGSDYLLLEMPFTSIPRRMGEWIHELRVLGVHPIIAHPERNAEVVKHPRRLAELIELGACAQVTSGSLLGAFGKRCMQAGWELCGQGLIHLVSSDAHHHERRGFYMEEVYATIARKAGEDLSRYYQANAAAVLHNSPIGPPPENVKIRGESWNLFSKFFRK
ncbi:protein tyrosine phosphatase [Paenibacillus sp. IB182496]|uniref:Tyrosine-protein phosphatase n=1 Tax=Paenibacillus sabuli TaxID=2772509 RepID=A0A927BWF4_9BACL|nr:CpsB/CapC family capsule biosynthesis tyrosine phosphatase [Paenibacillus sabuli]MBD2847567.1 protein tyrosine phosphatase [Paenibacillus sabuli]